MKASLGIASPKKNQINSVADLGTKILIVNRSFSLDAEFKNNYLKVKLLKIKQNNVAFNLLKDGYGDVILQDSTYALAWAAQNPDYVVGIPQIGNEDFIAPAVRKGNTELLNWLNTEIKKLRKEGEIQRIYNETLKPLYGNKVDPKIFLDVEGK